MMYHFLAPFQSTSFLVVVVEQEQPQSAAARQQQQQVDLKEESEDLQKPWSSPA
jgi:hypothetical protein